MAAISQSNITLLVGFLIAIGTLGSMLFAAFKFLQSPNNKNDKLNDKIDNLKKEFDELKETQLKAVQADVKSLTGAVNSLSITVTRLTTIIDERIPKLRA